jgi:hypothetical protein
MHILWWYSIHKLECSKKKILWLNIIDTKTLLSKANIAVYRHTINHVLLYAIIFNGDLKSSVCG